jgi:MoaA/NifB/PqqE/SkfB family radical SAM enzyme
MECAVITTYRCNAHCQMCHTWKYPTDPAEEITPEIINKIEGRYKRLNITGGEPMLREDIMEIVEVLDKKTDRLEISTNGYDTDKIIKVAERFPHITVRVSLEGLPAKNDQLRGIKNGFDHGLRTVLRLKDMGIKDIGFGIVISDRNAMDLLDLYHLCAGLDVEFGNSVMHNSFYFHKNDNRIEDVGLTLQEMRRFIKTLLQSKRTDLRMRVKDWFRAYINLGIMNYMQGKPRSLPCGAGRDTFFLDPWGNMLACNGSNEPWIMGNLKESSFQEIWNSAQAEKVRALVKTCSKNCWMTGTAVPAMRRNLWVPLFWVVKNKVRLALGKEVIYC